MVKCESCDGSGVVWCEFSVTVCSTSTPPACWEMPERVTKICPVCEGRGKVDDSFYSFKVTSEGF